MIMLIAFCFVLTLAITYFSIKLLSRRGILSEDLHKEGKPKKPKIGGISIVLGFGASMIIAYLLENSFLFLIVLLAFLVSATIGLLDDAYNFKQGQKLVIPIVAAVPLLFLVPWQIATVVALFLAASVLQNWTNMLAGFNGLEAGLGLIMVSFLAAKSAGTAQVILLLYAASLLAFLLFNKYPAKVFPGDVGTMPIGIILLSAYLLGAPLLSLCILLVPYVLDALLKFASVGIMTRTDHEPTEVRKGYLRPKQDYLSLPKVLMRLGRLREWQLVVLIWGIEILLGVVTLLI